MTRQNTALLVVDMQKESKYGIEDMQPALDAAELLIDACRSESIPVVYTRQIGRADGYGLINHDVLDSEGLPVYYRSDSDTCEIVDQIFPRPGDIVVDKYRWSAFHETALDLILRTREIKTLLICGFVTDCCVMTAVYDAFARNYEILLVKDACAATNSGAHKSAVLTMGNWVYGIEILDAAAAVAKLVDKPYTSWKSTQPDLLAFSSERLDECYASLSHPFEGKKFND
jgi:nicotinamidase-related amidase